MYTLKGNKMPKNTKVKYHISKMTNSQINSVVATMRASKNATEEQIQKFKDGSITLLSVSYFRNVRRQKHLEGKHILANYAPNKQRRLQENEERICIKSQIIDLIKNKSYENNYYVDKEVYDLVDKYCNEHQ